MAGDAAAENHWSTGVACVFLLQSPILRNILGQVKNKVSNPFVMDSRRIFIANLAKGRMGHDKSNLFGSLLISQFQVAAMARSRQPECERQDFLLVVDEFQNFATEAFTSILAEARKYRLTLTLSHQYIEQLTPSIRSAVFGNVGNLIAFRVGSSDADALANEFGNEIRSDTFVDLPRFHALAKIQENSVPQPTFKARLAEPAKPCNARPYRIISRSRERFSVPRSQVTERIHHWLCK